MKLTCSKNISCLYPQTLDTVNIYDFALILTSNYSALKSTIAGKIDSSICDIEASPEIPTLDETIASLPSNNQSFDAPIRPVSSSPVEDDLHKWQRLADSPRDDDKIANLLELKTNVKKTVDQFEVEAAQLNDASLNLSDATFKLSSLSLV